MEMVRKTHGENGAGHMENMWTKKHRAEGDEIGKQEVILAISDESG